MLDAGIIHIKLAGKGRKAGQNYIYIYVYINLKHTHKYIYIYILMKLCFRVHCSRVSFICMPVSGMSLNTVQCLPKLFQSALFTSFCLYMYV